MGTVHYMSPEQALGRQIDHRTDLFSLGVVLYEMATGHRPFSGTNVNETIDQIAHSQPESITRFNYNVPAELERIVRKCMEKDRERRYQSARDLLVDLKNLKRDIDLDASAAERSLPQPQEQEQILAQSRSVVSVKARRWLLAFGGMLALALLFGLNVGGLRERLLGGATAGRVESIAVLPLVNATADPNSEYLSDGITESIINSLSQLPKLRVMACTTVFRYKGKETDSQKVGQDLKVDAVLIGKVIHQGDTFTIQTELVNVSA